MDMEVGLVLWGTAGFLGWMIHMIRKRSFKPVDILALAAGVIIGPFALGVLIADLIASE